MSNRLTRLRNPLRRPARQDPATCACKWETRVVVEVEGRPKFKQACPRCGTTRTIVVCEHEWTPDDGGLICLACGTWRGSFDTV